MPTLLVIPAIMLVTWLIGRAPKVKSAHLPYVAMALGAVANVALGGVHVDVSHAVVGVCNGLTAAGLWSAAGKHVMQ